MVETATASSSSCVPSNASDVHPTSCPLCTQGCACPCTATAKLDGISCVSEPIAAAPDVVVAPKDTHFAAFVRRYEEDSAFEIWKINIKRDIDNHLIMNTLNGEGRLEKRQVYVDEVGRRLAAICMLGRRVCGHDGIVHGGFTATMFDDTMGGLFLKTFGFGFTANLNVNYRKPLPADTTICIFAEVDRHEGRKIFLKASIKGIDDLVYAEATALFITIDRSKLPAIATS